LTADVQQTLRVVESEAEGDTEVKRQVGTKNTIVIVIFTIIVVRFVLQRRNSTSEAPADVKRSARFAGLCEEMNL